jgi:hypothetical protein
MSLLVRVGKYCGSYACCIAGARPAVYAAKGLLSAHPTAPLLDGLGDCQQVIVSR